jgi:F-type H+-transporting ATPase subunit delta
VSSPTQIARRYAEALADAAEAQNILSAVGQDLHAFATLVASNNELDEVLSSPAVTTENKSAVLDAVILRAKPLPAVANFLRVLTRNTRIHYLAAIDRAFAAEVDRRTGVVMADVTTAEPLKDAERQALAATLARMTGKNVKLTFSTDGNLIGGAVTRIGSKIYDGSVRAKLDSIKQQMSGRARV